MLLRSDNALNEMVGRKRAPFLCAGEVKELLAKQQELLKQQRAAAAAKGV